MKSILTTTISILALLSAPLQSAYATFIDLVVHDITNNNLGLAEYAVYAVFDHPGDELVVVNPELIVSTTGFFHNSINGGGQWALPFTSAQSAMSDHPDADSFVSIGLFTGDDNATDLAPAFDIDAFVSGNTISEGWFNSNPLNDQGVAGDDLLVLIAVFTPLNDASGRAGIVTGTVLVSYGTPDQPGVQLGTGSFITPAPGALGLLALAGVFGRSRGRGHVPRR